MPSGYYTLDQLSKASPSVRDESPLDATEPKIEPEEPRDDYHRDWGLFAFLYESSETLAAGGLTSLIPISVGGLTLYPPDVWQVPNLELIGAAEAGQQAAQPADLVSSFCTDKTLESQTMQEICSNLAALDGCTWLDKIAPAFTSSGADALSQFGALFPNGSKVDWATSGPFCLAENVWLITATITWPDGSTSTCSRRYFDPPQGGDGIECTGATASANFATARDFVLACLEAATGPNGITLDC